jgi:pyruvate formate lyase activating enzyme
LKKNLILEIKGNSLDDGPGIRSVVFFKGCPLACYWCHNPESKRPYVEIAFDRNECVACDTCLGICQEGALSRENPFFINRKRCTLCFKCVEACPSGALSRVGNPMEPEEIVRSVIKDKPFFDTSGGGVTLSGGEPTMFMDFTAELLMAFKVAGIHTLIETCGLFDFSAFEKKLYPHLNLIYFDLKLIDQDLHARYCGTSNSIILENFSRLHALHRSGGTEVLARTPLIPDITDTDENMRSLAAFLKECRVEKAQLLPYHPLWQEKNRTIGIHDPAGETGLMNAFLDSRRIAYCKAILQREGIRVL